MAPGQSDSKLRQLLFVLFCFCSVLTLCPAEKQVKRVEAEDEGKQGGDWLRLAGPGHQPLPLVWTLNLLTRPPQDKVSWARVAETSRSLRGSQRIDVRT